MWDLFPISLDPTCIWWKKRRQPCLFFRSFLCFRGNLFFRGHLFCKGFLFDKGYLEKRLKVDVEKKLELKKANTNNTNNTNIQTFKTKKLSKLSFFARDSKQNLACCTCFEKSILKSISNQYFLDLKNQYFGGFRKSISKSIFFQ